MQTVRADEVAELLSRLVDKSLVHLDEETGRFTLLQLVRQYGQDQLLHAGEGPALRDRHLDFYGNLAQGLEDRVSGPDQVREIKEIHKDYENLRNALEWGLSSPKTWEKAAQLTSQLLALWITQDSFAEGSHWCETAIASAPEGSDFLLATIYSGFSGLRYLKGDHGAVETHEKGLALAAESGNEVAQYRLLFSKAMLTWRNGDAQEAAREMQSLIGVTQKHADKGFEGLLYINLGNIALHEGRLEEARRYYDDCLRVWGELGDVRGIGAVSGNLGHVAERLGDYEAAYRYEVDCIKASMAVGNPVNVAGALGGTCAKFWLSGDYETAAMLIGCSEASMNEIGGQFDLVDLQTLNRWRARLQEKMGEDAFAAAYARGRALDLESGVRLALQDDC